MRDIDEVLKVLIQQFRLLLNQLWPAMDNVRRQFTTSGAYNMQLPRGREPTWYHNVARASEVGWYVVCIRVEEFCAVSFSYFALILPHYSHHCLRGLIHQHGHSNGLHSRLHSQHEHLNLPPIPLASRFVILVALCLKMKPLRPKGAT